MLIWDSRRLWKSSTLSVSLIRMSSRPPYMLAREIISWGLALEVIAMLTRGIFTEGSYSASLSISTWGKDASPSEMKRIWMLARLSLVLSRCWMSALIGGPNLVPPRSALKASTVCSESCLAQTGGTESVP